MSSDRRDFIKKAAVPEGLDWDLFQGPAPRREYTGETWNYNWHWYGCGSRNGFEIDDQTGRMYERDAMKLWARDYEPGWEPKI